MTRHAIAWGLLARTVDAFQRYYRWTDQRLAAELGLSPHVLRRLRAGEHISADSVATLIAWVDPTGLLTWIVPASKTVDTKGKQCPLGASSPSS